MINTTYCILTWPFTRIVECVSAWIRHNILKNKYFVRFCILVHDYNTDSHSPRKC